MNFFKTTFLITTLSFLASSSSLAADESKGGFKFPKSKMGTNIGINTNTNIRDIHLFNQTNRQTTISQADKQTITDDRTDVNLIYKYSDAGGNGKQFNLDNGSSLHSGDKFTISITVNSDIYLYLYHFDSSGQVNELLSMSGYSNGLKAGQKLVLPAPDKHFYLDNKPGTETIHTIASKQEMTDLTQKYKEKVLSNAMLADAVTKGILIGTDSNNVSTKAEGRVIGCQAVESACRESFVITHLAR